MAHSHGQQLVLAIDWGCQLEHLDSSPGGLPTLTGLLTAEQLDFKKEYCKCSKPEAAHMLRSSLGRDLVSLPPHSIGQASDRPIPTEGVEQETASLDEKSC